MVLKLSSGLVAIQVSASRESCRCPHAHRRARGRVEARRLLSLSLGKRNGAHPPSFIFFTSPYLGTPTPCRRHHVRKILTQRYRAPLAWDSGYAEGRADCTSSPRSHPVDCPRAAEQRHRAKSKWPRRQPEACPGPIPVQILVVRTTAPRLTADFDGVDVGAQALEISARAGFPTLVHL